MNLSEKINRVIEIRGFSNYRIAKDLGISASTVANYRDGRTTPDTEILKKLAQYLGVTLDYLLGVDTGNSALDPTYENNIKYDEVRKFRSSNYVTTVAPLISQYAAAGYLVGYSDPEYIDQQPAYVAAKKYSGGNYVAFEIRGDSMNDGLLHSICSGDVVLGKELKKEYWKCRLHVPKVFIIVHRDNGILCKEIIEHDVESGVIKCHSYNLENHDFELNLADIAQLFYIKETTRAH